MNGEKEYIMSIDVGTQSVRAMVFNRCGETIYQERLITPPYYSLQVGWAELPAASVWENLCEVCRKLAAQMGDEIHKVAACGLTANRDNIIALDADDAYVRDWIIWVDQRRAPEVLEDIRKNWRGVKKLVYRVKKGFFDYILPRAKFNWFKYHEPETWKRAAKYLTMGGLITYKLTGEFADSVGMQVGVLPFDTKKLDYFTFDFIYEAMGVRRDQLAENLYAPGEKMGEVTARAAAETGLPEGLPIIAAGGDKQCEVLGAGAFSEDQAVLSYGTLATVSITSKQYVVDEKMSFYTFPSSIRGMYYEEFLLDRGFWLVSWFVNQYAKEQGQPDFLAEMNQKAGEVPAGSSGLFVYPFWAPHSAVYPNAKGAIVGYTDNHGIEHIYRAILESIAYSMRLGYEQICAKTKTPIKELIIVGGGSKSDVAMQLTADIFNVPAVRLEASEIGAIGAAIPAGIHAGFYADEAEAIELTRSVEQRFDPIPANVKVYNDLYENIYLKFYDKMETVFTKLDEYSAADADSLTTERN